MSKRTGTSLLDDTDRERGGNDADPELAGGDGDGDGTAYGTGHEADDAYLSVNGGASRPASGDGKLARCKEFFKSLSGKQWALIAGVVVVIVLIGAMAHHKPPHPPPHDPHSPATAGAEIEIASSVHHTGDQQHHGTDEYPADHHSNQPAHHDGHWDGEGQQHHETPTPDQHHDGSAQHHEAVMAGHHIGVVHEPDLEVPAGFEEVEGEQAHATPGDDDLAHAEQLAHEHGPDLHAPRIVHPRSAGHSGGVYEPQHSVHDTVAVLASGGEKPVGHPGDGHSGPHLAELTHPPHDLDHNSWSHVFEDVGGVRWFHVLRDIHVWRVYGKWENGKGSDEKGFHFTSWKPTDREQVRHGLGIHRQWQPMNELALLTLLATPDAHHPEHHPGHEDEHAHITHDLPTIIGVGPARATDEPPSHAHHETHPTHLPGGEPIVVLYTPEHWSHNQKALYAHRVMRVVERHELPRHPLHHDGLIHHADQQQHHEAAQHHETGHEEHHETGHEQHHEAAGEHHEWAEEHHEQERH